MIGRFKWSEQERRSRVVPERIAGIDFLTVELNRKREQDSPKQFLRGEKVLARQNIKRVLLPEGEQPRIPPLTRLCRVGCSSFYRAVADVLALEWLRIQGISPNRGRIILAAPRANTEMRMAAERLCTKVKELAIYAPFGGEQLAEQLWYHYGIPVIPNDAQADLTILFGGVDLTGNMQLPLYDEGDGIKGIHLSVTELELPEDCGQAILSLLWEEGRLKRNELAATFSRELLVNDKML